MLKPSTFLRKLKRFANFFGVDIVWLRGSPTRTLLGISSIPFSVVIDVGANKGQFAKYISGLYPSADLYCFEPLDEPYCQLEEWAATQNGRVCCYMVALGSEREQKEFLVHSEHSASSSLLQTTAQCHRLYPQTTEQLSRYIQVSTLDHELYDKLQDASGHILLKLDVQGYEYQVLKGARKVLRGCKALVIEINLEKLYADQAEFRQIVDTLADQGFLYRGNIEQVYDNVGNVVYLDALFSRDDSEI